MSSTRYPFRGEADLSRLVPLIREMPLSVRHVVDLPWRRSSPAIHEGRDAVYWEDADGQIIGFAAWQQYWATLDFFILPGPEAAAVEAALFAWANERFRERDEERGYPLPYGVEIRDDLPRRHLAQAHGFVRDEAEKYVLLEHALGDLPPVPALPAGFALLPLAGAREAAAYSDLHRAAFESESMTPEWRLRTLRAPQYRPPLDLVAIAPDGLLAGFCVGWISVSHPVAQIEPFGVHPRYRGLGIGRALLLEALHRSRQQGVSRALVETDVGRAAARRAYESVGFRHTHTIRSSEQPMQPPA